MTIINTISAERFSIDGIHYFKNFFSVVFGDKITIYNAFDNCDVRLELVKFDLITLNGVVYSSAILLQQNLLPNFFINPFFFIISSRHKKKYHEKNIHLHYFDFKFCFFSKLPMGRFSACY